MDDYIIKKNLDSYGNDCGYYPNKTIEELIKISNYVNECIGFNSKGYLKSIIVKDDKLMKSDLDLYINTKKINNIILNKKQVASGNIKKDITFVITTCKRLDTFIKTMNNFLYYCQDIYVINKWVCIDDNSSDEDRIIMKNNFPFFNFILKHEENKGHAKSLNFMFDIIKTKYVFMFEDDWDCSMNFYIEPYIRLLNENIYHQIVFHTIINDEETFKYIRTINNTKIYEYVYSSICQYKYKLEENHKRLHLQIEKEFNIKNEVKGFFHPGFSLNPSIFNFNLVKKYNIRFKEGKNDNEIFETYFAFQCLKNGFNVCFSKIGISHSGWGNSSYILNGMQRSFEIKGTIYMP